MATCGEIDLGAHMSAAGGAHRAVEAGHAIGFSCVQLFTKNNNQWAAKPLTDAQVASFRGAVEASGIGRVVAHNSYLINLGSPDDVLWNKSVDALTVEVERAEALGIPDLVIHPGAHVGSGVGAGLARVSAGIDEVHRRTKGVAARIDLETTAGQGSCLGHDFEHLQIIIEAVAEPERLGVCLDSCHLLAAGYPIDEPDGYDETFGRLERAVGPGRVRVWHLNDSAKPRGSRVDRHAGIGRGHLGVEPFRRIVNDPRFLGLPMLLETPKGLEEGEELDAIHVRTLRGLVAR